MASLSPIVFAQHAEAFLVAAQREAIHGSPGISMPAYFLASRAIELALKSYLLTLGQDERALRAISHDLGKAFDEAVAAGLRDVTSVSPEEEHCVRWINEYYGRKDLEYPTTGFKSYPQLSSLTSFAERLVRDLKPKTREWGLALIAKEPSNSQPP